MNLLSANFFGKCEQICNFVGHICWEKFAGKDFAPCALSDNIPVDALDLVANVNSWTTISDHFVISIVL